MMRQLICQYFAGCAILQLQNFPRNTVGEVHVPGGGEREKGNQPGNEEPKQVADGGC